MANEERKQRNIEMVMETAYRLILRYGIDNTSKEMLVRASGISRSSLDRYFVNKTDCVLQTAEWVARQLSERMNELSALIDANTKTGLELFYAYMSIRRQMYYENTSLYLAIAEMRTFVRRNCADSEQVYTRMMHILGFQAVLVRILAKGRADGTLQPNMDEQEEAFYINGFFRELLINLSISAELPADRQSKMLNGFIERMLRYYQLDSGGSWSAYQ